MDKVEKDKLEAIILAGGFGSRLQSVVQDIPKPMAAINNTPFLEYVFHYLLKQQIKHVVLSVGYKYEIIESYFGNHFEGIEIDYTIEDEPKGTGGGIKLACEKVYSDHIIVINGDTFFSVDLNKMMEFHIGNDSDITIAVKEMENFDRYGVVEFDKESMDILDFKEKQFMERGFINAGVYIIRKNIFDRDLPEKFSFEKDVLENLKNDLKITAFTESANQYFIDIGIPEDYQKAQYELERVTN